MYLLCYFFCSQFLNFVLLLRLHFVYAKTGISHVNYLIMTQLAKNSSNFYGASNFSIVLTAA